MSSRREVRVYETPAQYEALHPQALTDCDAVVFDVLRATSSIVTAMAHRHLRVVPCLTVEEALHRKREFPRAWMAGERERVKVPGFDLGNSPQDFLYIPSQIDTLIMTTSNGTRALHAARTGAQVWIGALLNLKAVAENLKSSTRPLHIFCSGTFENFALEDSYAAALLLDLLDLDHPLRALAEKSTEEIFAASENACALYELGLEKDVRWCVQRSVFDVAPKLTAGYITATGSEPESKPHDRG